MPTAAFMAVATIGSAAISANAAKSAANTQLNALGRSIEYTKQAADRARQDVLDNMGPGMDNYIAQMELSRDAIVKGDTDVMSILQQSTGEADRILSQSGADAQRLIMGSQASSRGVPWQASGQAQMQSPQPGQISPSPVQGQTQEQGLGGMDQVYQSGGIGTVQTPAQVPGGVGYNQARADLSDSRDISIAGIQAGRAGALGQLSRGEDILAGAEQRGLAQTSPYTEAGAQASQQEAALSGALGQAAQQQAIDNFIESPGQQYLRERQEQALLRSSAATGGLGGGRVLTALQEQAMGIAATQQQQQLQNLGTIAQRGMGAAMGNQNLIGQTGAGMAGMAGAAAGVETGASRDLVQIESIYGPQIANMAMQTGLRLADIQQMTDQQRSGLVSNLGAGLAGVRSGTMADISNLSQQIGVTGLNQGNLTGQTLANIGTQAGTNIAGYTAQQGSAQAAGTMAAGQAIAQGVSGLGAAAMYGSGYNPGSGLPSYQANGSAPIINPYTNQIQGGM